MSNALFVLLLLLTALDLAFVHATDVVAGVQLLPLWALAIGSLWLRQLQAHALYRRAWNAAVLAVFALLVHHATTTGLLHMLEDGLVLAVLCQVHLLNNVGDRQRPDLIFFNSFLVAFVTSFFAPDVTWSLLFVAHAFVLVPGLQLHAMLRRRSSLDARVVELVLRDSVPRTVAVCALAAAVFVVCPRDFRREGWLGDTMLLRDTFETGAIERIQIGNEPTARLGDEIVAHLTPASGEAHDVPSHWRTNVFSVFDGSVWSPQPVSRFGTRIVADGGWRQLPDGAFCSAAAADGGTAVRVRLHDLAGRRLPLPLGAARVTPAPGARVRLEPDTCGGITLGRRAGAAPAPLAYVVDVAAQPGTMTVTAPVRHHFLALPDRELSGLVHTLVLQLHAELPAHADALAIARATADWLAQHRRYQLPGNAGFARHFGEFLLGSGAGHCEYFATALALLLRLQDVPCRVAGGWLAHEWDADSGAMVLRGKHAHAWVEVLAADGSWHTFDATPAAAVADATAAATSWWSGVRQDLERWWAAVTGFDRAAQARWFERLRALPAEHPAALAAALAIAAAVVYLRRRRRQAEPTIKALELAMRAARVSLRCGETPRELLARAAAADLEPRLLARLTTATRQHEASRYRTSLCNRRT